MDLSRAHRPSALSDPRGPDCLGGLLRPAETTEPMPPRRQPAPLDEALEDLSPDAQLLAAHIAGTDPYAFTELTRRHRSHLWRAACAILRDPQDAEDAVQDAMLRAFVHAKTFRGESSVYVWLRTLTVNVSTSLAAKRTRHAIHTTSHNSSYISDPATAAAFGTVELDELMRRALGEIPEDYRDAFVLVQLLDMPVREVAELQRVRPATIYTRVYRARLRLVELLDYRQVIDLLHQTDYR